MYVFSYRNFKEFKSICKRPEKDCLVVHSQPILLIVPTKKDVFNKIFFFCLILLKIHKYFSRKTQKMSKITNVYIKKVQGSHLFHLQ